MTAININLVNNVQFLGSMLKLEYVEDFKLRNLNFINNEIYSG